MAADDIPGRDEGDQGSGEVPSAAAVELTPLHSEALAKPQHPTPSHLTERLPKLASESFRDALATFANSRRLLRSLLALPALWLLLRWAGGASTFGEIVNRAGIWSALLLVPVVSVTPLRRLFGETPWLAWFVARRRDVALASFAYAGAHAAVYLIGKDDLGLILQEAREPWLLAGWAALTIFLAPGTIRDEVIVTALRRRWERLHHLLYLGAALIAVHWALSAFDPLTMQVQAALHAAGYYAGPIDGIIGVQSREALREFQRDHRLTVTGTITPEVLDAAGIVAN